MVSYLMEVDVTEEALEVLILIVVEDGLVLLKVMITYDVVSAVLILIVVEDGLVQQNNIINNLILKLVLILIVVEDGLVLDLIRLY